MDTLRWILLGLGLVVLVVVYLASRPSRPRRRPLLDEASELEKATDIELRAPAREHEPVLKELRSELRELSGALSAEAKDRPAPPPRPTPAEPKRADAKARPAAPPKREELLLVFHVSAHPGERFEGPALLEALQAEGLEPGDMDIFHRMVATEHERLSLFGVANAVKPGTLIPEEMTDLRTPGLSLFLRLPAAMEAEAAFDALLYCADRLAERLDGEVQDQTRSALTRQTREHLREKVREWAFRNEKGREE